MPPTPVTVRSTVDPAVPGGAVALIAVGETTLNAGAAAPPKLTPVAPSRLLPLIVTVVPPLLGPVAGPLPLTTGASATSALNCIWNALSVDAVNGELSAVKPGVNMRMKPAVVPYTPTLPVGLGRLVTAIESPASNGNGGFTALSPPATSVATLGPATAVVDAPVLRTTHSSTLLPVLTEAPTRQMTTFPRPVLTSEPPMPVM